MATKGYTVKGATIAHRTRKIGGRARKIKYRHAIQMERKKMVQTKIPRKVMTGSGTKLPHVYTHAKSFLASAMSAVDGKTKGPRLYEMCIKAKAL